MISSTRQQLRNFFASHIIQWLSVRILDVESAHFLSTGISHVQFLKKNCYCRHTCEGDNSRLAAFGSDSVRCKSRPVEFHTQPFPTHCFAAKSPYQIGRDAGNVTAAAAASEARVRYRALKKEAKKRQTHHDHPAHTYREIATGAIHIAGLRAFLYCLL
jgi:hypothetical protein